MLKNGKSIIFVLAFMSVLSSNSAALSQNTVCVLSTITKKVTYLKGWHGDPIAFTSSDSVDRGKTVKLWVDSGWFGCPPYYWSLSGTGFALSKTKTYSDFEVNNLKAEGWACGSGSIKVTDSCGKETTAHVRSTVGKWADRGWRYSQNYRCLAHWHAGTCAGSSYDIEIGFEKWILTGHTGCAQPGSFTWRPSPAIPEPPCGSPEDCDYDECSNPPCVCGINYYQYLQWACP